MYNEKQDDQIQYTADVQKLFLEFVIQDAGLFPRIQNIFNPENFDKSLKKTAKFIVEHAEKHSILPDRIQVKAVTGTNLFPIEEILDGHVEWFLEEFEKFTKRQELERAILLSADLLQKGDYGPVETLIKNAVQISLTKDLGTDYYFNPRARIERVKNTRAQISTGWKELDFKLFGGVNRGELSIYIGGSGAGKSVWLQNQACNWSNAGMNGVYITLELSEDLSAQRIDAMQTGYSTREIFGNLDNVELKLGMLSKRAGRLHIKYMPAGTPINNLRAYVKELEIKTKEKIDFLIVDYLDLLMPSTVKVDPSNLFIKDKFVTEELRNLMKELDTLGATASQMNRDSVEEVEFNHGHIAGGISKIYTADNIFAIYTSRAMKERGKYQLQLLKTRSSTGVGSKVDFDYDINSLRIIDAEQQGDDSGQSTPGSKILQNLKAKTDLLGPGDKTKLDSGPDKIKIVNSNKLKDMLAKLNKSD